MIEVRWKGGMAFEATASNGTHFVMDAPVADGGENLGPSPVETLVLSLAACTAMDVVIVLNKKKQQFDHYRVELAFEKRQEGKWPRPVEAISIVHVISGPDIDPTAMQRAIDLSYTKYCSVLATLQFSPTVSISWRSESADA